MSPVRAPKFQLAVEQPSTGGHWNPLKKYIYIHVQRKAAAVRWYEGYSHDKIKSIPARWATQKLENNNSKEVLPLL